MFVGTFSLIYILQSVSVHAAKDGDVRLVDSDRYGEGRVEVFYQGSWGTICESGWDLDDAEVLCRQLGFPHGAQRSFYGARFGEGSGSVLLSDVNCVGDENNLLECEDVQNNWNMNDCQHRSDVGVKCSAPNYEGCLMTTLFRASDGFQANDMTLEKCFQYCSLGGYRYFWMHNGDICDCGNDVDGAEQVGNERCNTECPGNSDQHCGGRDFASLYKAEVDLPYVASPGFPGRFISTGGTLPTRTFNPSETRDYSFISIHQFDLPSTVNWTVMSNDHTESFQGRGDIDQYWTASTNSPINISFQLPQGNIDSLGFLLEFGEGTYCPTDISVSDGNLSTTAVPPFTVGTKINVRCNSGYVAFDDTVFCQADGTFNREFMCISGRPTTTPSTTQRPTQPTQQRNATGQPPSRQQPQQTEPAEQSESMMTTTSPEPTSPGTTVAAKDCVVPSIENGKVDSTEVMVSPGDFLQVTCDFPYMAVESTVTCQRDGNLSPSAECGLDIIILIVIGSAALIFILILVLIVTLVCCLCYYRQKKRRRVSSYERRTEQINLYGGPPPLSTANRNDEEIVALPDDDDNLPPYSPPPDPPSATPPPPPLVDPPATPPVVPPADPPAAPSVSSERGLEERESMANSNEPSSGANAEQAAVQSLDNVDNDVEQEPLYGRVKRPNTEASGGFGGNFSRN